MNKYLKERYDGILGCLPDDDAAVVREVQAAVHDEAVRATRQQNDFWSVIDSVIVVAAVVALVVLSVGAMFSQERITRAVATGEAEQQELRDRCLDCLLEAR